ncbi:transketolase [Saccharomonospora viridis]|uniref:Transketolase n=1 Tax=Saccharomonospora viridis (strain ATCC 15386 / DSM 43017 / JCM 3036 / CCUG 5913 / NBRC 12207 / NCIMB 9602 / P101) TaxID=471857 RepID=C7MR37_SACVD|nr:transketolase [Saccharomonospora viridis]ACU98623.1 transketolase [Saccharomonospora viridis DSM 43017]
MAVAAVDHDLFVELGRQLRVDAIRAADFAGSGHPTSSMSAADLMAVLLARHLRYDFEASRNPANDHLIFSKGHASPLLYAMYVAAGAVSPEELRWYRSSGSRLQGHPTPALPWVDAATGALGQGLGIGAGIALAGQRLDHRDFHVWVLCGDGELAEGSMWEAFEHAGYERLHNLIAIIDVNRLGQRGPTRHGWDTAAYARRIGAFGWHTIEIDGHDVDQIDAAYAEAKDSNLPTAILARTRKGKGVREVENAEGAHGKPVPDAEEAVAELGGPGSVRVEVASPEYEAPRHPDLHSLSIPTYERDGRKVATRTAFGQALAMLGHARSDLVVLDADVSDSTRTSYFAREHPDRFFECYIAEQQMTATAVGMSVRGWLPFAATFAAFWSRAFDFVRMASIGGADLCLAGSHAGVSIGPDGPSQMGLEDLAAFRALWRSTVLYPCDANQTVHLTAAMAEHSGIRYLRTTREDLPVLYGPEETFSVGGSKVLRRSDADDVTIVAAGITVHEALRAADVLADSGIRARVVDLYSIKPVDVATLRAAAADTGRIVTVEDHWPQGGLGDAVLDAFTGATAMPAVIKLGVLALPGSATPTEQLQHAGIDADSVVEAAQELMAV